MLKGQTINVGEKGFVRVVDWMGDDHAVAAAARVSYGNGEQDDAARDEGLIRYLMRHQHTSPFEMCEIKLHIRLPLFVARQWMRHRTASVNEISARYTEMKEDYFVPADLERYRPQSTFNHQSSGDVSLEPEIAATMRDLMTASCADAFKAYGILGRHGLSRELARIVLPVATYTEIYWKMDLHNLFRFLRLRMGADAQEEIRVYARAIYSLVELWVPFSARAFRDYVLDAVTLSRAECEVVANALKGNELEAKNLKGREKKEFQDKMDKIKQCIS